MEPSRHPANRILVAGVPRSGTTWLARMLGSSDDTSVVIEPDNAMLYPYALRKRFIPIGFDSALTPGHHAPALERLWKEAFGYAGCSDSRPEAIRRRIARGIHRRIPQPEIRLAFTPQARTTLRVRVAE